MKALYLYIKTRNGSGANQKKGGVFLYINEYIASQKNGVLLKHRQ
jgi:hypothetical protein